MSEDQTTPAVQPQYQIIGFAKADGLPSQVVQSNQIETDDMFKGYYIGAANDKRVIPPTYDPTMLDRLCQENNTLSQCIEAMVINIEGTGFDFEADKPTEEDAEDDINIAHLWDFFTEPWPGESFLTMRKEARRDLERTGNAYFEVIRNPQDEIVYIRHMPSKMTRLVEYDAPVNVTKKVRRRGKVIEISTSVRERRYVMMSNNRKMVYFKEFGASRDLDKDSGEWALNGNKLPAVKRASEVMHFTNLPDANTPYGIPKWITQTPSIVGSRLAEEYNIKFFRNGAVPPIMIFLSGGSMDGKTRQTIESKAGSTTMNGIAVVEVAPSGGSIDDKSSAKITVERFGAERQDDSMFEGYDEKCSERVRAAFRLPPIFVGKSQDYNFATAVAGYRMAEAQVFKPEREEFDEIFSMRFLPGLGFAGYRLKSKALVIQDADLTLNGIELALSTNAVDKSEVVEHINGAVGTNLKYKEPDAPIALPPTAPVPPARDPVEPEAPELDERVAVPKSERIVALALDTAVRLRKRDRVGLLDNLTMANALTPAERDGYHEALASLEFLDPSLDATSMRWLMGCTAAVIAANLPEEIEKTGPDFPALVEADMKTEIKHTIESAIEEYMKGEGNPYHDPKNGRFTHGPGGPKNPQNATDLYEAAVKEDGELTTDIVLGLAPEGTKEFVESAQDKLDAGVSTHAPVSKGGYTLPDGSYTPERLKRHEKIISEMLSDDVIRRATPAEGEQPTVAIFGGRGGSGKSWLSSKDGPVDGSKFVIINSDDFKEALPEYKGWNAGHLHEEAGHIADRVDARARALGLNVIHDTTMRNDRSVNEKVALYKSAGYRVEGHYMFASAKQAAQRAMSRFMTRKKDGSGRYVPIEYIITSTTNEATFDSLKPKFEDWTIHDNNTPGGTPKLYARKKK